MIRVLHGDCRDVLPQLEVGSVHCVVTSPPYYGLRDYGTAQWDGGDAGCDHKPDARPCRSASTGLINSAEYSSQSWSAYRDICGKCGARRIDRQIGLEATPDEYIQTMVAVFRQIRRVMRDDAVAFINMGDSYQDKQLLMMPARLALALQADGWWIRSDIIWAKPNPMPESVTDRPTSAHEHVFLLSKSARYYYDADAVREEAEYGFRPTKGGNIFDRVGSGASAPVKTPGVITHGGDPSTGRNLRNVWTIATAPFPEAHFATFPPALAETCIKAGTSERGCCVACGAPWVRQTETERRDTRPALTSKYGGLGTDIRSTGPGNIAFGLARRTEATVTTTGWAPGCRCDAPTQPCTVLDPFAGAGTMMLVADRLQRDAIGIELNEAYAAMSRARLTADAPLLVEVTD